VGWLYVVPARAQFGPGGTDSYPAEQRQPAGPRGATSPVGGPPGSQPPGQPESHAASGGESGAKLPTQAPQLPQDPNAIPPELDGVLGSDFDPNFEMGRGEDTTRSWYGPYYSEQSGDYQLRTLFPLWFERTQGNDRASLFGLSYYNRRSPKVDADIFFPLFWKLRYDESYTTVVGPWAHNESPTGHHNWLAPLFFEGAGEDGMEYMHIPPLLTFSHRTARDGFQMAGPAFCSWKGGARCDARTADEIDLGIAPLYFWGRDKRSEYEIIPPLLHYYSYQDVGEQELEVWGPLWLERSREGSVTNLLPLFWHSESEDGNEAHTTVFPLFHYGYEGASRTIATPLFVHHRGDEGEDTFATYLYARHRGRTELDMITPLFWQYRDPDIDLERTFALPFFYRNVSPRSDDIAVFPFYGHFERHGIYDEHWVTPLFRHRTSLTGWNVNLFPAFHMGRTNNSTHLVAAPLLWDFASPKSRQTVVFPFYWRFSDRESVSQLVGNTYYYEEKAKGGSNWEFHLFPVFSYGETPQGHWWNFLYGMAGYTRDGTMSKMRVGYIPFLLSE
jgi:hypothetical protein